MPDILIDRKSCFYILDAKYYLPNFKGSTVENGPGNESLTKQFLYQLLIERKIKKEIRNVFLFPDTEQIDQMSILESYYDCPYKGDVYYEGFEKKIELWYLPPKSLFHTYLSNKRIKL